MPEPRAHRRPAYAIALAIFAFDRLTKWLIETQVSLTETYRVIPGFFSIVHAKNPGAAFGIFADSSTEVRTFFLVLVSLAALVYVAVTLWRSPSLDRRTMWGLALIMGGAMGNIFDRIVFGTVTDFLLLYIGQYEWPAFNVADSAITIGAGLVALELLTARKEPART
jgi:signal peptidase II